MPREAHEVGVGAEAGGRGAETVAEGARHVGLVGIAGVGGDFRQTRLGCQRRQRPPCPRQIEPERGRALRHASEVAVQGADGDAQPARRGIDIGGRLNGAQQFVVLFRSSMDSVTREMLHPVVADVPRELVPQLVQQGCGETCARAQPEAEQACAGGEIDLYGAIIEFRIQQHWSTIGRDANDQVATTVGQDHDVACAALDVLPFVEDRAVD
jgi:hypothetical protein